MRLFQNAAVGRSYPKRLAAIRSGVAGFRALRDAFLADRYNASHVLEPVLNGDPDVFFANGDDEPAQRAWAREQGMPSGKSLDDILLAQIEAHRTEVFYNLDPVWHGPQVISRLPSSVKRTIAWRAAPSPAGDFGRYDLMVCNFKSILENYRKQGRPGTYFAPSHDPGLDAYAAKDERPIDVLFTGSYSRHHMRRAAILEAVAALNGRYRVVFALARPRMTRLAETPLGLLLNLAKYRRPKIVRAVAQPPVFGRALYEMLSQAKIVLNGAIDMAGEDRGNMRCFEAMGCGALLVSDAGHYPEGMEPDATIKVYRSPERAAALIEERLMDKAGSSGMASLGRERVVGAYSKSLQWQHFTDLAGRL